jgi:hypothetical protein
MVYCRPASQFCCGCSVEFGVKSILVFNLHRNLFFVFVAVMTMVFKNPMFSYSGSLTLQTFLAGLAIAGVPLILLALWAVHNKSEGPLRLYSYYMVLSFLIDMVFVTKEFIISGACSHIPTIVSRSGEAFACGAARGANTVAVVTTVSIELYLIFIIFSYCEDLALSGGPDLSDLAGPLTSDPMKRLGPYRRSLEALNANLESNYGCAYSRNTAGGLGGSQPIFGGEFHELEFPPHRVSR